MRILRRARANLQRHLLQAKAFEDPEETLRRLSLLRQHMERAVTVYNLGIAMHATPDVVVCIDVRNSDPIIVPMPRGSVLGHLNALDEFQQQLSEPAPAGRAWVVCMGKTGATLAAVEVGAAEVKTEEVSHGC